MYIKFRQYAFLNMSWYQGVHSRAQNKGGRDSIRSQLALLQCSEHFDRRRGQSDKDELIGLLPFPLKQRSTTSPAPGTGLTEDDNPSKDRGLYSGHIAVWGCSPREF